MNEFCRTVLSVMWPATMDNYQFIYWYKCDNVIILSSIYILLICHCEIPCAYVRFDKPKRLAGDK